jgi:hypothetical protein
LKICYHADRTAFFPLVLACFQFLSPSTPQAATPSRPSTPVGKRPAPSSSLLQTVLSPSQQQQARPSHPHVRTPSFTRPSSPSPNQLALSSLPTNTTSQQPLSISTPQQFYDWFSHLTSSLEHEADALYRDHLAEIASYRSACDRLLEECESAEEVCGEMKEAFRFVEERSKSLQMACEELLEEQVRKAISPAGWRRSFCAVADPVVVMSRTAFSTPRTLWPIDSPTFRTSNPLLERSTRLATLSS